MRRGRLPASLNRGCANVKNHPFFVLCCSLGHGPVVAVVLYRSGDLLPPPYTPTTVSTAIQLQVQEKRVQLQLFSSPPSPLGSFSQRFTFSRWIHGLPSSLLPVPPLRWSGRIHLPIGLHCPRNPGNAIKFFGLFLLAVLSNPVLQPCSVLCHLVTIQRTAYHSSCKSSCPVQRSCPKSYHSELAHASPCPAADFILTNQPPITSIRPLPPRPLSKPPVPADTRTVPTIVVVDSPLSTSRAASSLPALPSAHREQQ